VCHVTKASMLRQWFEIHPFDFLPKSFALRRCSAISIALPHPRLLGKIVTTNNNVMCTPNTRLRRTFFAEGHGPQTDLGVAASLAAVDIQAGVGCAFSECMKHAPFNRRDAGNIAADQISRTLSTKSNRLAAAKPGSRWLDLLERRAIARSSRSRYQLVATCDPHEFLLNTAKSCDV
ncbi:hypothetical protein, partial [Sinorhizobium psoraleae]|uniref:hypothetical protein n=1 Tax=Sinorhizobium psoraleae TaxID=520838 RepID=UPI001AED3DF7